MPQGQLRWPLGALLLALALTSATLPAQEDMASDTPRGPTRAFAGFHLIAMQPVGEFRSYIDWGGGLEGEFLYALDRQGALGFRLNMGWVIYGYETKRVPLSPSLGRIQVDVTTSNNIFVMSAGPQIMVPNGTFRPYLNATAGLSYFFTRSDAEGSDDYVSFASTTNFDDTVFSWAAGGGVYIPLRRGRRKPLSLDIGAQYQANGEARYLREGSIEDDGNGGVNISPIRSHTNLMTYRIGVTIGL